jgi:hypothetical protein
MRIYEIFESRKTAEMKYGKAEVFEIKSKLELDRYIKKFGIVRAMLYPDMIDVWDASDFTHGDYEEYFGSVYNNGLRLQIYKEPTYYLVEYESRTTDEKEITNNKIFKQIFKNAKYNLTKSEEWLDKSYQINEVNMNIQDIIPLPVINNLPQQKPRREALNSQLAGLILALDKFGLTIVANWLAERIQADPGGTVSSVLDRIPQQPKSEASFQRQAMAARVIANKLGLYTANAHLKQFL